MTTLRLSRPEILRKMPRPLAVLEASAGTGKTWTLERLFVELVLVEKLRIEQILAVTFTERATAEMKMRVRQTFEQLLRGELDEAPEGAPADAVWTVDDDGRRRVERALAAFDTASISTIHSFCQRALTEYAFPGGRLLAQKRAEGRTAFGEAFRESLRTSLSTDASLVAWLSAWQARKPLSELEDLLWQALRSRSPFLPPFDEAAFAAAAAAVPAVETLGAGGIAKAFESIVAKGSRNRVERVVGNVLEAVRQHRARPSLPALLAALSFDKDDPATYLPDFLDRAASTPEAERMRGALLALSAAAVPFETGVVRALRGPVSRLFEANKRRAGEFDFDDMISEVASAVGRPEGEPLVRALRSRFRAALIDEFQDTDDLQWGIFRKLFYESKEGHRLVVIGDPKQAIYSFRGADVTTYLEARGQMTSGAAAVPLDVNYRSTPAMVGAVNALLDQAGADPVLGNGDIRYDRPVKPGRRDLSLRPGPKGAGAVVPVKVLRMRTTTQEKGAHALAALARRIAVEIRSLLDGPGILMSAGCEGKDRIERRIGPGDIYVLTPKVRESRLIGECLDEARIPYAFYREDGLLESAEADDFLDVLRALAEPADTSLRMRALLTPFFGLSLADLDGARDLPPSHPALRRLLDGRALALAGRWSELFRLLLAGSGLVRRELATASGERSLTNFHHLAELLQQEAARRPGTLSDLCRAFASWTTAKALPEGEDVDMQRLPTADAAVQVMTIHKAKGLEAPVVFLFGGLSAMKVGAVRFGHGSDRKRFAVAARKMPGDLQQLVERDERAEERRLLYVAATRAKGLLVLPYYPDVEKTTKTAKPGERQESIRLFTPKCPYHPVNLRLRAMLAGPIPVGDDGPLFSVDEFDPVPGGARASAPAPDLSGWSLPPEVRETPPDLSGEFEKLGSGRAGFFVTSYTGLKRLEGSYRASGEKPSARAAEGTAGDGAVDGAAAVLPGGIATGTMLHALLEEADPATLAPGPSAEEWAALPGVAALLRRTLSAHQFDPSPAGPHSAAAARLVHAALTATIPLPGGGSVAGLGLVPGAVREMEFLYPVPEATHPLLSGAGGGTGHPPADGPPFRIGRGCVTGFVDLLFTHEGKSWFVDWKSDVLPAYDAATLAEHVEKNYATQADLYTVALLRLLDIRDEASFARKFGGFLYVFLRGLDPSDPGAGAGIYGRRASWKDVEATERSLLDPGRFAALEKDGSR